MSNLLLSSFPQYNKVTQCTSEFELQYPTINVSLQSDRISGGGSPGGGLNNMLDYTLELTSDYLTPYDLNITTV